MLSYITWRWEIADVMHHFTKAIDLLAEAEKKGGFELAADCLLSLGKAPRQSSSPNFYRQTVQVTAPCPRYDFDICVHQLQDAQCLIQIFGGRRYAGFILTCGLPATMIKASLDPDVLFGISWR